MTRKNFFEVIIGENNVYSRDPEVSVSSLYRRYLKLCKDMVKGRLNSAMNPPCNGCTACCTNIDVVELGPNDNPADYTTVPGPDGAHRLLKNPDTGHCIHLVNGQCEIYAKRPETCRMFDCRIYAICGTTYGQNNTLLDQRILEWNLSKMIKTREDHMITVATRMCLFTLKEQNFPALSPSALLAHKSFLEEAERLSKEINQDE